jgi:hypothetical protein
LSPAAGWVFPVLSRSRGFCVNKCKWDYLCGSRESLRNRFLVAEKHGDLKACGGSVCYEPRGMTIPLTVEIVRSLKVDAFISMDVMKTVFCVLLFLFTSSFTFKI